MLKWTGRHNESELYLRGGKLLSPAALNEIFVSRLRKTVASDLASSKRRSVCLAANQESCARASAALIWALCAAA